MAGNPCKDHEGESTNLCFRCEIIHIRSHLSKVGENRDFWKEVSGVLAGVLAACLLAIGFLAYHAVNRGVVVERDLKAAGPCFTIKDVSNGENIMAQKISVWPCWVEVDAIPDSAYVDTAHNQLEANPLAHD